jgi:hypothetical protein
MVKAVQQEKAESPNTMGKPPKQKESPADKLKILNPEDDVDFKIDFGEEDKVVEAVASKAMGGTELMRKWLFAQMETREPGLITIFS